MRQNGTGLPQQDGLAVGKCAGHTLTDDERVEVNR